MEPLICSSASRLFYPFWCRVHHPSGRPILCAMLCKRFESYMPHGEAGVGGFPDWPVDNLAPPLHSFGGIRGKWLSSCISPLLVSDFIFLGRLPIKGSLRSWESHYYLALRCFVSGTGLFLLLIYVFTPKRRHLLHRSLEGPDNSLHSRSQVLFLRFLYFHRLRKPRINV